MTSETPLPSGILVAGGQLAPGNMFAIWGDAARGVLVVRPGRFTIVCPNLRRPVGVAVLGDEVEVVDSGSSAIYWSDGGTTCGARQRIEGVPPIVAARRIARGWLLATIDSNYRSSLWLYAPSGKLESVRLPREVVTTPLDWNRVHLTTYANGIILSTLHWPFEWVSVASLPVGSSLPLVAKIESGAFRGDREAQPSLRSWLALPVFPLDSGFVQVIADPASDKRLLILFDANGKVERRTELDVAFGILATNVGEHSLLAVRRSNTTDVLLYKWQWNHQQ